MSSIEEAARALQGRRIWQRAFIERRNICAARGDHDQAALWSELACVLYEADDAERATLQSLDFTPGVTVLDP